MTNKIHAVGILFESGDGRILTLQRHAQVPEGGTWGLVGGKVENGKTPIETAILKASAEIGYSPQPQQMQHLKTYYWDREDLTITFDVLGHS